MHAPSLALLLLGTQRFFYKVAAEKQCSTAWVTFTFMTTVTLLSAGLYFAQQRQEQQLIGLLVVSFVNSAAFLLATVAHIEALKYVSANITYTIIQLNVVVVVIFSMVYFKDRITTAQGIGLLLGVFAMIDFSQADASRCRHRGAATAWGLVVCLALAGGAAATISAKFAAIHTGQARFYGAVLSDGSGGVAVDQPDPAGRQDGQRPSQSGHSHRHFDGYF